jgi:hypothetical protein
MGRRHYWVLGLASSPHPQAQRQIFTLADSHAVGIARIDPDCSPDRRRSVYQCSSATLGLIVLATIACGGGQDTAKRDTAQQTVAAACSDADSLIFSDLKESSEDGGLGGHEIVLHHRMGGWAGSWRGAGGGSFGAFEPIDYLKGDSIPGPFSFSAFSYPRKQDTTLFRGQIYCDSLVGELRYYSATAFERAAYLRKASLTNLSDDTVPHVAGSPSPPPPQYRDSADVFDPDGYYSTDLTIDGQRISWFQVRTVDFFYDHQSHDDRPRLVLPPKVNVVISNRSDADGSVYPCTAPVISPDSLSVRCVATPVGDLTVDGHFLDKAGKYERNPAYDEKESLLLIARVVVTKGGKVTHDAEHRFMYTVGD